MSTKQELSSELLTEREAAAFLHVCPRGLINWRNSVIDNTNAEQPSLTIVNEVDYTGRVLSESAKRLAIKEREQKIQGAIDLAVKHAVKDK